MRTKDEALAKPMAGDRWRMSYGEEYEVVRVENGYVHDVCTQGIDAGQGELSNPISNWTTFAANAEYLGGANE